MIHFNSRLALITITILVSQTLSEWTANETTGHYDPNNDDTECQNGAKQDSNGLDCPFNTAGEGITLTGAGIIAAGVLVLIILAGIGYFYYNKHNQKPAGVHEEENML